LLPLNKKETSVFHYEESNKCVSNMDSLTEQLKQRRKDLGLKQYDMLLRVGMSRQQYQRLESRGNPRLDTLELLAKGLKSEIMLIPQEKLSAVKAILEGGDVIAPGASRGTPEKDSNTLADNPWQGLLEGDDE
jgi:DNA-binding XRE family transcriptional regulator